MLATSLCHSAWLADRCVLCVCQTPRLGDTRRPPKAGRRLICARHRPRALWLYVVGALPSARAAGCKGGRRRTRERASERDCACGRETERQRDRETERQRDYVCVTMPTSPLWGLNATRWLTQPFYNHCPACIYTCAAPRHVLRPSQLACV